MSFFSELVSTLFERRYQKLLSKEAEGRSTKDLARALLDSIGEVSGMAMAHTVLDRYAAMNADEKLAFFEFMTHELEIDPEEVIASLKAYKTNSNKDTYRSFAIASEPKRKNWPGGSIKCLVRRGNWCNCAKTCYRLSRTGPIWGP